MPKKKDSSINFLPHILGLFTGFLGPLIMYLATDDSMAKKHAAKALNWQISVIIYAIVSVILMIILIGFLLIIALFILDFILCIIATVKATKDELWDYPLAIPFIKT
jgi:uncharacterized Tic20 family protein